MSHSETSLPDVQNKVTLVTNDYKDHPVTETSALNESFPERTPQSKRQTGAPSNTRKDYDHRKHQAEKKFHEAEEEGLQLWEQAKERLLRPGTLGGLIGIVNVGLIGAFGYQLYHKPALRSDARFLGTAAVSGLVLLGGEGYLAESYRMTAAGQEEERRARAEGAAIYRRTKEVVLRPGVLGGLVGVVNLGILGGVGYTAYVHWDQPNWDRRTVSAVTVGLLALFGAEGYLGEEYIE